MKPHSFGHVHEYFLRQIELCSVQCKQLEQESAARNHETHSRNLCKFLVQDS